MSWLFNQCFTLINLNISNFNTKKVTTLQSMFNLCTNLTILDLSYFNAEKVTTMRGMFNE